MQKFGSIFFLTLSLALANWGEGRATTWTVAKDGSGDYSVIQDALDVCAAGDTVRIGPGRYDELKVHTFALGGTAAVIMIPTVSPLTILGSEQDSVIIGPSVSTPSLEGYQTACFVPDLAPPVGFDIQKITFENVDVLAVVRQPSTFTSCCFRFMTTAAIEVANAPDLHIQDCEFESNDAIGYPNGILEFSGGINPGLIVRDCTFRHLRSCIAPTGATDLEISGCYFEDVGRAAFISEGCVGSMRNCEVGHSLPEYARIHITSRSVIELENLRFSESAGQLEVDGEGTQVTGTNLILTGGTYYTVLVTTGAALTLHNCDVLNGGGQGTVQAISRTVFAGSKADLRNCYWGTTDSTQIAQWTYDGNDDPQLITVQYMPVLDKSITPAKDESMGGLKALFQGGH